MCTTVPWIKCRYCGHSMNKFRSDQIRTDQIRDTISALVLIAVFPKVHV